MEIAKQSGEGLLILDMVLPSREIADVPRSANISSPGLSCPFYLVIQLNRKEQQLFSLQFLVEIEKRGVHIMSNTFEDAPVISSYTWEQGVEDGALAKVFENRWPQLSNGKPIVATASIIEAFSLAALREIRNDFVVCKKNVEPTLPEEDRLFSTKMNKQTVWVMEDEAVFTILFPSGY